MLTQVLVIDDDEELTSLLAEYLAGDGFAVRKAFTGSAGLAGLSSDVDLVLLDVMLPDIHGFEVLRRLRQLSEVPVLMLTARGEEMDRVVGLQIGADDYLPKPFSMRELAARMQAILRRVRRCVVAPGRALLQVGDLRLDQRARLLYRSGQRVELTSAEFDVLFVLVASAGTVVSREHLAEAALGRRIGFFDRCIDNHISSLRRKLGPPLLGVERICTVRGSGYLYAHPESGA